MTLGPEHWCPLVGDVDIQGPVAGGRHGWPFGAGVEDLAVLGYVEEEYFVAGMAPTYALAAHSAYTRDGRWSAERSQVVPFRTRIVVRASSRVEQRVHGARSAIRAGTELQALAGHTETAAAHREGLLERMKTRNQDYSKSGPAPRPPTISVILGRERRTEPQLTVGPPSRLGPATASSGSTGRLRLSRTRR
jgi:hypothetical protein